MLAAKAPSTRTGGQWRFVPSILAALVAASMLLGAMGISPVLATDPPSPAAPTRDNADKADKPGKTPESDVDEKVPASEQRVENVIAATRQYLGVPYLIGTEGPYRFDCSGLVFRAFTDAGLGDRISGNRLRAAGYMRWFARQGLMTANEEEAQRGDLVIYNGGKHIGIYLGDGRTISALLTGVTVHGLHGISQTVTGFLRPDWSGEGSVPPFVPIDLPDVAEEPAVLVPTAEWILPLDETTVTPVNREGDERVDLRTPTSRTFANDDGTLTTEFHAQPIHYLPRDDDEETEQLEPIDLHFDLHEKRMSATVKESPVVVTARPADADPGFLSATAGHRAVTLTLATEAGMFASDALPEPVDDGRVVDYFDFQPEGIGLRVLARPDGFKSFLVLDRNPGTDRFSYVLDSPGLTAALDEVTGDVLLADDSGMVVARLPRPLMLDSSGDSAGGGLFGGAAAYELVRDEEDRTILTVTVRANFLEEAVYPAYVDMSLTGFPAASASSDIAFVSSRHSKTTLAGYQRPETPAFGELWLGHQPRSRNDNEVYIRFNELSSTLGTVDVANASLELLPYWQRADDVAALVRRVASDWSAETLTWETRPLVAETDMAQLIGTAGEWATLDVSPYVTDLLSRGATDFGLLLYGAEDASGTWKRLAATDGADAIEVGPRLVVTWSGLRPSAVAPAPLPDDATGGGPAADAMPAFAWTLPTIAPDQVRFQVELSADGFQTVLAESGKVRGRDGRASEWSLPDGTLITSGHYQWRVRVMFPDGDWSEWSAPATFDWKMSQPVVVPTGATSVDS
jgi:cell wall-associated NlpC family hydrolase